jgi:hypothetical protein
VLPAGRRKPKSSYRLFHSPSTGGREGGGEGGREGRV